MRIAMFSPLPPKKTGIATYSRHLSAALSELADVHLFDTDVRDTMISTRLPVTDFAKDPQFLTKLDDYDGCIYQIGNNPLYHLEIYKVLLRKPGIVVLHDTVLYYLIAGLNIGGLVKEFCLNYGIERLNEVWGLVGSCPNGDILRYKHPERYPFLKRVFDQAGAIIVHSETAKTQVQEAGYAGPVHKIQHLFFQVQERFDELELNTLRANLELADTRIVIGCFGFIGATKRITSLIDALELIDNSLDFKLLIVGEGDDTELNRHLRMKHFEHRVVRTGFVRDEDFTKYLALTDIVVNLRYPSMGETSGTLIRAFFQSKPCIVTDHAWFSELPDDCVRKVPYDEREVEEIAKSLLDLAGDPNARDELGKKAREYVVSHCSLQSVAHEYLEVVRRYAPSKDPTATSGKESEYSEQNVLEDNRWVETYLMERIRQLLPTQ